MKICNPILRPREEETLCTLHYMLGASHYFWGLKCYMWVALYYSILQYTAVEMVLGRHYMWSAMRLYYMWGSIICGAQYRSRSSGHSRILDQGRGRSSPPTTLLLNTSDTREPRNIKPLAFVIPHAVFLKCGLPEYFSPNDMRGGGEANRPPLSF